MKSYLAFFDLDNTLLSGSSGRFLARYSYKKDMIGLDELAYGVYSSLTHRAGIKNSSDIVISWVEKYRGWPEKKIKDFCERLFEDVLVHQIRHEAREAVEFHRSNGAKTVILSASISQICEPVQKHLGMDDLICTSLEAQKGILTGKLTGKYCHGLEKLNRAILYCSRRRRSLEDAFYYADSAADLSVLDKVGYPMCVTPDRRLRRVARQRGWPVLKWK